MKYKYSRNAISGEIEVYSEDCEFVGKILTMGDVIMAEDKKDRRSPYYDNKPTEEKPKVPSLIQRWLDDDDPFGTVDGSPIPDEAGEEDADI